MIVLTVIEKMMATYKVMLHVEKCSGSIWITYKLNKPMPYYPFITKK